MGRKFISWRRVSTAKQSMSGLGLEAQKSIIDYFVKCEQGELIADYQECHTGTSLSTCIELKKAMEHCKRENACLIIAKVDRFRTVVEALQILDYMGEGNIMFCDLPQSDRFTLTLYMALAEREALIIGIRTKQALAAKKARGGKIGAASDKYYIDKVKAQERAAKAATTRARRVLENRDNVALIRIMKQVFPLCATTPETQWCQSYVSTKREQRLKIVAMMTDYKAVDESGTLFAKWDLSDPESVSLQHRLASKMQTIIKLLNNQQQ